MNAPASSPALLFVGDPSGEAFRVLQAVSASVDLANGLASWADDEARVVVIDEAAVGPDALLGYLEAELPRTPVVVLRPDDDEAAPIRYLEAGAATVLSGPLDAERTSRALRRALARQAAHDARAWEDERYRLMVEHTFDIVAVLDGLGRYVYASPSVREKLGYDPAALLGESAFETLHPDDLAAVMGVFMEAIAEPGSTRTVEYRALTKDGEVRHLEGVGRAIVGRDGQPYGVINARDVTDRKQAEAALRSSEALLRQVVSSVPVVVFALGPDGRVLLAEGRGLDRLGVTPGDLVGRPAAEVYRDEPSVRRAVRRALRGEAFETIVDLAGRAFEVYVAPVLGEDGLLTRVIGVAADVTELREQRDALAASRAELRALAAHLQEVREEERTRISREVHDVLGQQLTAIRLGVGALARRLAGDPDAEHRIADTRGLIDETIRHVRQIARELRPGILDDFGLGSALEWHVDDVAAHTGLTCTFTQGDPAEAVPPEVATACFRIVQEAMTNAVRHARAGRIDVAMDATPDGLRLRIQDDGVGIEADQLTATHTLGLLGMRERARAVGGHVEIAGTPGAGTRVEVVVPLPGSRDAAVSPSDPDPHPSRP